MKPKLFTPTLSVLLALGTIINTFPFTQPAKAEPEVVSVSSENVQGNRASTHPSISTDGRFVAFLSEAENLVPDDTNGHTDIFVHDRLKGKTERVSVSTLRESGDAPVQNAAISGNGRFVVFQSRATNLVPGNEQSTSHIYLHDRLTGVTERVSVNDQGEAGNGDSSVPGSGTKAAM